MNAGELPTQITSRMISVRDSWLHYLEGGTGAPIVFLHGNPTSSFLWRNVLPHVVPHGRCLAVDLIGMGQSGKPAIAYRLRDHIAYIDAFIEALGLANITFVLHDWGVAIGLHYLTRYPERVRAVAFMEGHLHPIASWADYDPGARAMFGALRSEPEGRRMVIEENFFIEAVLPSGVRRRLTVEERAAYGAPFLEPRSREPLWRWPNEIPIEGQPADVHAIVSAYQAHLAASSVPKLLLYAQPGAVIGPAEVAWCRANLDNLLAVDVGAGIHFLPEDQPGAIGEALASWLPTLP